MPRSWVFVLRTSVLLGAVVLAVRLAATDPAPSLAATAATDRPAGAAADDSKVVKLDEVTVTARREALLNSIDRKVYNVGKDILSASGSASDLLQNVPSINVDIDGNVSLRGSDNVLILINGRTSPMMGANRAAVLEQMPAESIERIEVITNPSAKYKPDGTAGIINLVLKKKHDPGFSGSFSANVGNDDRYNSNFSLSLNPGRYTVFGNFSFRHDERVRYTTDTYRRVDATTGAVTDTVDRTEEAARPLSRIVRAGFDYNLSERTKVGVTGNYNYRTFRRHAAEHIWTVDDAGAPVLDFDRSRYDPEYEKDLETTAQLQHAFAHEGRELNLEFKTSRHDEQEDNHYTNTYRTPVQPVTLDNMRITQKESGTELVAEYVHPLGGDAKIEMGYTREANRNDSAFHAESSDAATGQLAVDPNRTHDFHFDETVHAAYATYARTFGPLGFLGGVRVEQAFIGSRLVESGTVVPNDYFRLYPSLHLSYGLATAHELQLNYSHRVRRPEGEDLNPFPEYQDPTHLRRGNPHLRPEDIHSFEIGHQYKQGETSVVTTAYYRYLYNSMTDITREVTDPLSPTGRALETTKTNLSSSRSLGIEFAVNADLAKWVKVNLSTNTFFNTIDATDLGLGAKKSAVSWIGKLGATFRPAKDTLIQFYTNTTSSRLTPQGRKGSTYVANLGVRQEILQHRAALVLTVSDLFNSLQDRTFIDTPTLREEVGRRRSARIIYAGFVYEFGKQSKKQKDDGLKFDEGL
jgi:outer membrane receptor protein involved in Fe transport